MAAALYTIFGGTGFLGRRIVRHLLDRGARVRVASRHPRRADDLFRDCPERPESVRADIHDTASIEAALDGAKGAANAVSLYVEKGRTSFQAVHVDAAARVARCAHAAGLQRLVHISGIGADAKSSSPYIRSRGQGEKAVRAALPAATILRPAVMFGADDAFLTTLIAIARQAPLIPLFGNGDTRIEPAYVHDVAEAAARVLTQEGDVEPLYELAGPERYRYRELLAVIAHRLGRDPYLLPVPMALWHTLGWAGEMLPGAPLTRNQVELMQQDNVASPAMPGFGALKIEPHTIAAVIEAKAA